METKIVQKGHKLWSDLSHSNLSEDRLLSQFKDAITPLRGKNLRHLVNFVRSDRSMLMQAIKQGKNKIALYLMAVGADIEFVNRLRNRAIDYSARNNNQEVVNAITDFLRFGKRPKMPESEQLEGKALIEEINRKNAAAYKPLDELLFHARDNEIEQFDVWELRNSNWSEWLDKTDLRGNQWPAVVHAALGGHAAIVRRLCMLGASTDVAYKYGNALYVATEGNHIETVRVLLEECVANPDQQDQSGRFPLLSAVGRINLEMVKLYMAHGAKDLYTEVAPEGALGTAVQWQYNDIANEIVAGTRNRSPEQKAQITAYRAQLLKTKQAKMVEYQAALQPKIKQYKLDQEKKEAESKADELENKEKTQAQQTEATQQQEEPEEVTPAKKQKEEL